MTGKESDYLDSETKRSLKVLRMKRAHASIEEVERQRKRAAVLSVRKRLQTHVNLLEILSKTVRETDNSLNDEFRNKITKGAQEKADNLVKQLSGLKISIDVTSMVDKAILDGRNQLREIWMPTVKMVVIMVDSLRHDYQKALDIGQKDFDILFPRININLENVNNIDNQLLELFLQEANMILYCDRLL
jgi:hypothetical protein